MSQAVDRKATHGWGSTPAQRHFITHEQALKVLEAGVKRAKEIKYVYLGSFNISTWMGRRNSG
jgi:hypothetical protein